MISRRTLVCRKIAIFYGLNASAANKAISRRTICTHIFTSDEQKKKVPLAGYTQEVGRTLKTPERNTDSKRHESAGSIPEYFSISAFSPSGY